MIESISRIIELIQPWLLSQGIRILLIITIAFIINKLKNKFIEKTVRAAVKPGDHWSKDAEIKREDTLIRIFKGLINILIITIAFIMVLNEIGVQVGPILAGAGIIGLAIGFGGQYLIKDLITGFFLLLENQYRIGDVVEIDKTGGLVEDISLRMTTLRDLNGTIHHIPHGDIKRVSNLSKKFARVNLNIGVSYSANLEHVIEIVNETGQKLAEDPEWSEHIILAPQFLRVDGFADSAVIIKILGETKPLKQWDVTGELRKRILIAFHNENIEIPFPQLVVHKKPGIATDIQA